MTSQLSTPREAPGQPGPAGPGAADDGVLVAALCQICQLAGRGGEPRAALLAAAHVAAHAIPGAVGLGLSLGPPDEPSAVVATDATASSLDGWQLRAGEGPALDAWREQTAVRSDALGRDERWPALSRLAAERGPLPVLAVPVADETGPIGVLTCYLSRPAGTGSVHDAQALGTAIGGLVRALNARVELRTLADHLQQALTSRALIDQAKGIVMADRHCTPDEAFRYLVTLSQQRNVKLRDIAGEIVGAATSG